jgi:hypothetical protein
MLDSAQLSKARQSFHSLSGVSEYVLEERRFVRTVEQHLQALTPRREADDSAPCFEEPLCARVIAQESDRHARHVRHLLLMSHRVARTRQGHAAPPMPDLQRVEFAQFGADLLDCMDGMQSDAQSVPDVAFDRIAREYDRACADASRVFMGMLTAEEVTHCDTAAGKLPNAHCELTRTRFKMRVIDELLRIPLSVDGTPACRAGELSSAIRAAEVSTLDMRAKLTSPAVDGRAGPAGAMISRQEYAADIAKIEAAVHLQVSAALASNVQGARCMPSRAVMHRSHMQH